jgi:hypothetical protein
MKKPKWSSEAVNRKGEDTTVIKGKRTKGQKTIYKTLHIKLRCLFDGLFNSVCINY